MATRRNGNNGDKKTASKTALAPPPRNGGARLPLGAHAGNTGGKPGRSGRKSIAFVEECERLTDDVVIVKVAKKLASAEPDDAVWRWCAEYVSKYTKTEPPKKVEHGGDPTNPVRFTLTIGQPIGA